MNYERVATLLASPGLRPQDVASILGVSPARISQLLKEEDFRIIYEAKKAESDKVTDEEVNIDNKYLAAENALLTQIIEQSPSAELRDAIAALKVVGERQDRKKQRLNPIPVGQGSPVINTIVQLTLPSHAVPELQLSSNREVIAIGNQNLAPLSSKGVTKLFAQMSTSGSQNSAGVQTREGEGRDEQDTALSPSPIISKPSQAVAQTVIEGDFSALDAE